MGDTWEDLAAGRNCPFDEPITEDNEHLYFIRKLSVSSLYLDRNQAYAGHCVLVYDLNHRIRMDQLSRQEWAAFATELYESESAIYRAIQPDHINVGSYGNIVPHLHWHIFPRFKDDGRWGAPIWTTTLEEMPTKTLTLELYQQLAESIGQAFEKS